MNLNDLVIPVAGFILIVVKGYYSGKDWYKKENIWQIIMGIIIMGYSIWNSDQSSTLTSGLVKDNDTLTIKIDSLISNNNEFQKYLKDSLGVLKNGNAVTIVNRNVYNSFPKTLQRGAEFSSTDKVLDRAKDLADINDAAARLRDNRYSGLADLRRYFTHPKNPHDSSYARQQFDKISKDVDEQVKQNFTSEALLKGVNEVSLKELRSGIMPVDSNFKKKLQNDIRNLRSEEFDLYQAIASVNEIRAFSGINFNIYDIDKVESWYKKLKGK